jgi:hypothetical protein
MEDQKNEGCESQAERDNNVLRMMEPDIVYYGPHECEVCKQKICRVSLEQGGMKFDYPDGIIYPNTNWVAHVCPDIKPEDLKRDLVIGSDGKSYPVDDPNIPG